MISYLNTYRNQAMNRDFSLIDANLSRAKEGLRAVEEVARFIIRDHFLFEKIRVARHQLIELENMYGLAHRLQGRIVEDVGQSADGQITENLSTLFSVLKANFTRVEEALRVLEEYSKIYWIKKYALISELRYQIYKLEFDTMVLTPHYWLNLYFEAGVVYTISDQVEEIQWLINHGAKIIQLRDKENDKRAVYEKGKFLSDYIRRREEKNKEGGKILLIINDYVDVVAALTVAGVHIGQDVSLIKARRILGAEKIIGRSNGTIEEMKKSAALGADYVSLGPIYSASIKPNKNPVGIEAVKVAGEEITVPWVAIGGINTGNVEELYELGVKNVAVIRAAREFFIPHQ